MQNAVAGVMVFLALSLIAGGSLAQQEERYRLERTDNGYVRMDKETGAMSLCRERSGELICRPANEAGGSASAELDTLRERLAAVERRLDALEGGEGASLPTEEEFEQTLGLMERFFRRFVDIVRGLEEEERAPQPNSGGSPAPAERT
ncbi:hypothetical protein [Chelativorans sp. Marseille-P2723]|uniref:hypothetical protein n=1 Tax=Chelativorans sp. Marseille-P2723 TaxID=2709133 RepID=UPI0015714411|nr:hypothetical protein [Chelativorans sp. Marseille-P2723]